MKNTDLKKKTLKKGQQLNIYLLNDDGTYDTVINIDNRSHKSIWYLGVSGIAVHDVTKSKT